MAFNDEELEHIEQLIDNINMGTAKVQLGKIFIGLMNRVAELEAGGGESAPVTWASISGKPAVIAAGANQAAARTAIGAIATADLPAAPTWANISGKPTVVAAGTDAAAARTAIGASDIPAAPTWSTLSGKPATFTPTVGTGATQAAAGNHDHAITADAGSGLAAAANLQALAVALSGRIKALEDAPA